MSQAGWSADRVITLKSLWLDGLSASQVAGQLGGVTRNAVIGKIHRLGLGLGLGGRAAPSAPARAARTTVPRSPRRTLAPRPRPPARPIVPSEPVERAPEGPGLVASMTALGAHDCKWPIGDPKAPSFSFCGRLANGPYCPAHEARAFQAGTAWRAERDPVVRCALAGLV
jgi:GcrA cell cycle regulator